MPSSSQDDPSTLERLLHDVRTPLGVAHGYLRMLREQRLAMPEHRAKAMVGVTQALAQMTHLCDVAAGRAPTAPGPDQASHAATLIADQLAAELEGLGLDCRVEEGIPAAAVLAGDPDTVVALAALLVRGLTEAGEACVVGADAATSTLRVSRPADAGGATLLSLALETARS